jgi:hypothetical protein
MLAKILAEPFIFMRLSLLIILQMPMEQLGLRLEKSGIWDKVSAFYSMRVEWVLIYFLAVFFEESWSELVVATSPYNEETIERTLNDVDRVYAEQNTVSIL